jgi:hypothetical protein
MSSGLFDSFRAFIHELSMTKIITEMNVIDVKDGDEETKISLLDYMCTDVCSMISNEVTKRVDAVRDSGIVAYDVERGKITITDEEGVNVCDNIYVRWDTILLGYISLGAQSARGVKDDYVKAFLNGASSLPTTNIFSKSINVSLPGCVEDDDMLCDFCDNNWKRDIIEFGGEPLCATFFSATVYDGGIFAYTEKGVYVRMLKNQPTGVEKSTFPNGRGYSWSLFPVTIHETVPIGLMKDLHVARGCKKFYIFQIYSELRKIVSDIRVTSHSGQRDGSNHWHLRLYRGNDFLPTCLKGAITFNSFGTTISIPYHLGYLTESFSNVIHNVIDYHGRHNPYLPRDNIDPLTMPYRVSVSDLLKVGPAFPMKHFIASMVLVAGHMPKLDLLQDNGRNLNYRDDASDVFRVIMEHADLWAFTGNMVAIMNMLFHDFYGMTSRGYDTRPDTNAVCLPMSNVAYMYYLDVDCTAMPANVSVFTPPVNKPMNHHYVEPYAKSWLQNRAHWVEVLKNCSSVNDSEVVSFMDKWVKNGYVEKTTQPKVVVSFKSPGHTYIEGMNERAPHERESYRDNPRPPFGRGPSLSNGRNGYTNTPRQTHNYQNQGRSTNSDWQNKRVGQYVNRYRMQ